VVAEIAHLALGKILTVFQTRADFAARFYYACVRVFPLLGENARI